MNAIIIDLDGTLCDVRHRTHLVKQSPPDWPAFFDACVNDTPTPAVVALYRMARESGVPVIYVSGRPETHRAVTEAWLERYRLDDYKKLLMRAAGDYRQDAIVKRELYEAHIAGKYEVLFTVDDRLSVCRLWHSLGIPVFRFGDPDADF